MELAPNAYHSEIRGDASEGMALPHDWLLSANVLFSEWTSAGTSR